MTPVPSAAAFIVKPSVSQAMRATAVMHGRGPCRHFIVSYPATGHAIPPRVTTVEITGNGIAPPMPLRAYTRHAMPVDSRDSLSPAERCS